MVCSHRIGSSFGHLSNAHLGTRNPWNRGCLSFSLYFLVVARIDYLAENIWVTTSGNFRTQALHCTMLTMGADRILFSNDYPYEDYAEGGDLIETVAIGESDRRKIDYGNAKLLYKL